jgi:hypothetical protein
MLQTRREQSLMTLGIFLGEETKDGVVYSIRTRQDTVGCVRAEDKAPRCRPLKQAYEYELWEW